MTSKHSTNIKEKHISKLLIVLGLALLLSFPIFLLIHLEVDFGESVKYINDIGNIRYFAEIGEKIKQTNLTSFTIFKNIGPTRDNFRDLSTFIYTPYGKHKKAPFRKVIVHTKTDSINPTLLNVTGKYIKQNATNMEKFQMSISRFEMYGKSDHIVHKVLHDMANLAITAVTEADQGTQVKLIITYPHKVMAMFKPYRFPRHQQTLPNHYHFNDFERHNAEIAAFHLDRLLGFRRALPVTGRVLNMTTEVKAVSDKYFNDNMFISPSNNMCFECNAPIYCDMLHGICADGDLLEGSLQAYLPQFKQAATKVWIHPWRRLNHRTVKMDWETDDKYCEKVRNISPYNKGRRLLDLMDMAVFDFISGNHDRHQYETFEAFENNTFTVHHDHGRGFGRPYFDDFRILAPLLHCCLIRASTLKTLLNFQNGEKRLSQLMKESLLNDPVAPILWEPHYPAMDRRVEIILQKVRECINKEASDTSRRNPLIKHRLKNRSLFF